jgi:hypothetical protein
MLGYFNHCSHLPPYEDGTDRVFQHFGIQNSDDGELSRRKQTTFRTRRKFEIINRYYLYTPHILIKYTNAVHKTVTLTDLTYTKFIKAADHKLN